MHGPRCKRKGKENGVRASSEESQEMSKTRPTHLLSHSPSLRRVCVVQVHMPVQVISQWIVFVSVCLSVCTCTCVTEARTEKLLYWEQKRRERKTGDLGSARVWNIVFFPHHPAPQILSKAEL